MEKKFNLEREKFDDIRQQTQPNSGVIRRRHPRDQDASGRKREKGNMPSKTDINAHGA